MSARIHLSVNLMAKEGVGIIGGSIGVQITALSNEHHYYNMPTFMASNKGLGGVPTFVMIEMIPHVNFPVKLERGEQVNINFNLVQGSLTLWQSFPEGTTFHAEVTTTEGESYASNEVPVANVIALLNNRN